MEEKKAPKVEVKPGIRSTEFWLTTVVSAAGMLAFVGIVSTSQQAELTNGFEMISDGVNKIIAGIVIVAPILRYATQRTALKIKAMFGKE